jgi:5-methyltetrahydrofolate--homocysteine methyltransferase
MVEWVRKLRKFTNLPIMVKPNAGMPVIVNGKLQYDIGPDEFADFMKKCVEEGAQLIGGCCGTTHKYISKLYDIKKTAKVTPIEKKVFSRVSSYGKTVNFGDIPLVIGERINPTGKKLLKEALKNEDMEYVKSEAVRQIEAGAHVLDVNVGLPGVDEVDMLSKAIKSVQSITDLPLQIDTSNVEALEKALRIYNGIPLINSVNGKKESMKEVFPLAKKYGAMIVGLTLDESGIDDTAEGRIKVALNLINTASLYGIGKEKLLIDPLAMTISTGPNNAKTVLEIIDLAKKQLGVKTVLGVSNISFGLPNRQNVNSVFFAQVLSKGLDAGIIDPTSDVMMSVYYSFLALNGQDENCGNYVAKFGSLEEKEKPLDVSHKLSLEQAVFKGLSKEAIEKTEKLLKDGMAPLDIVSNVLMPALDKIGEDFEKGTIFLPQLLSSAESAKSAFNVINTAISASGQVVEKKGTIVLATVEGDIHDIGKNIVKVVLENYGYEIIDLGRDVKIEKVVDAAIKNDIKLVGLSALMTTTVDNMRKTIVKLREKSGCKIMVGGAVLTQDYAKEIGADFYAKDALASVKIAEEVFSKA